jgi:hypothetical protein
MKVPRRTILQWLVAGSVARAETRQSWAGSKAASTTSGSDHDQQNVHYIVNRAPLKQTAFVHLPLGAVKPRGWLKDQLRNQADGLSGYVYSAFNTTADNGNAPYFHEGIVALAYTLEDERILKLARHIVEKRLAVKPEIVWHFDDPVDADYSFLTFPPASVMRFMIEYQEATGDPRVIPWMLQCYHELSAPNRQVRSRYDDWTIPGRPEHLVGLYWLYNRTGDRALLEIAGEFRNDLEKMADDFMAFPQKKPTDHGVMLTWMTKYPGMWYQQSLDDKYRQASLEAIERLHRYFGQVGGRFAAHEHLPPLERGHDPSDGTELCNVVESAYSMERLFEIFGEVSLADRLELLVYNSVPGAMTPDFWAHQYDTQANQVLVSNVKRQFDNGAIANVYGLVHDAPCCLCNMHQPWPRFVENLWMATHDNGVVAVAYAPCEMTAKVGDEGASVTILEETDYPFEGRIRFTLKLDKPTEFPLYLRIPTWDQGATVRVDNTTISPTAGSIAVVKRRWNPGDVVELALPMRLRTETRCNDAVSILRGTLYFSLRIGQDYRSCTSGGQSKPARDKGFPVFDWEVHPTTPWNYALELDRMHIEGSVEVVTHHASAVPFAQKGEHVTRRVRSDEGATLDNAEWKANFQDWGEGETQPVAFVRTEWRQDEPVVLKVKGRRVPGWGMKENSADNPPPSPVETAEPVTDLELVPYGCTRLRISEFPVVRRAT